MFGLVVEQIALMIDTLQNFKKHFSSIFSWSNLWGSSNFFFLSCRAIKFPSFVLNFNWISCSSKFEVVFSQPWYSDAGLFIKFIMLNCSSGKAIKNKRLLELTRSESAPVSGSCPVSSGFLSCSFEELFDQAWSDPEFSFEDFSDDAFCDNDGLDFPFKKVIYFFIYLFIRLERVKKRTILSLTIHLCLSVCHCLLACLVVYVCLSVCALYFCFSFFHFCQCFICLSVSVSVSVYLSFLPWISRYIFSSIPGRNFFVSDLYTRGCKTNLVHETSGCLFDVITSILTLWH